MSQWDWHEVAERTPCPTGEQIYRVLPMAPKLTTFRAPTRVTLTRLTRRLGYFFPRPTPNRVGVCLDSGQPGLCLWPAGPPRMNKLATVSQLLHLNIYKSKRAKQKQFSKTRFSLTKLFIKYQIIHKYMSGMSNLARLRISRTYCACPLCVNLTQHTFFKLPWYFICDAPNIFTETSKTSWLASTYLNLVAFFCEMPLFGPT